MPAVKPNTTTPILFEITPNPRRDGYSLNSSVLLFPLWFPNLEGAVDYARSLGRRAGCDVRVNNPDGGQAQLFHFRGDRSPARGRGAFHGPNALELLASNRELREQIDVLTRLEWELLETNEREHRRFGWDLHEDLGQQLSGITFLATLLAKQLETNCPDLVFELRELVNQLRQAILHTRNIARGLYPIGLENGGLFMVLEELAGWTTQIEGTPCRFSNKGGFVFPQEAAIHLYRIAQEGVNYLLKAGKARQILIECLSVESVSKLVITGEGGRAEEAFPGGGALDLLNSRARMIGAAIRLSQTGDGDCVISCTLTGPAAPGN